MKRTLIIILILAFCLTVFSGGISASGSNVARSVNEDSTFLSNQDASNDAYNKMLQTFADERKGGIEECYPDYYAGAHIGEDGYTKDGTTYKVIGVIKVGNSTTSYATKHSYLPWTISVIS